AGGRRPARRPGRRSRVGSVVLDHHAKYSVVERSAWRTLYRHQALAFTGAAEDHVARPGAARQARFAVVTAPAIAPEILDRAVAHEAQRCRALPDAAQPFVSHRATGVRVRRQARAAFDRAVG